MGTVVLVAAAFVARDLQRSESLAWALVAAALALAVWWQRGIELSGTALDGPTGRAGGWRRAIGALLALAGAGSFALGSAGLVDNWARGFDRAWMCWSLGTVLLALGLDLLWARWSAPRGSRRGHTVALVLAVVAVGAVFRLGTFYFFPAPYHVTQVEELQVGAMATDALAGGRLRWEYLSQAWLGALGITVGGPTLLSTRLPSTILSFLKLAPLFLLLRFMVGTTGALVGSLLMALSIWDTLFARVATNHDVFVVLSAFALLAGPARRGRPSAYVVLGLLSGYVFFEYVLYRPLAVFAVAGAFLVSLRDRHAGLAARLLRPLLVLAILVAMTWPLYRFLVDSGRTREFFDGYGRARANHSYYSPDDSWETAVQKRLARSQRALSLLFFSGPDAPTTNPDGRKMVDPFTSLLLVVGTGYALAHPLRQIFGLVLLAGASTYAASLVLTGNFDFVRSGSALGYVYALAGVGAAGLAEALRRIPRAGGRVATALFMTAGVAYAAVFSTSFLHSFVTDPRVQRAQFRDLAYLASWIATNTRADERVVVAAPNFAYLMEPHDAAWLRGEVEGAAFWDLHAALLDWAQHPQATLLLVHAGSTSAEVQQYLRALLPSLETTRLPGPIGPEKDLLFARRAAPPQELARVLERWGCQPVAIEVDLLDEAGRVLTTVTSAAGAIDAPLWPGEAQEALMRLRPQAKRARVRFVADFRIEQGGEYLFPIEIYPGQATLRIDSMIIPYPPTAAVQLAPGVHHLDLRSEYDPNAGAPLVRLFWQGPDSGGRRQLLPFYRVAAERCPAAAASSALGDLAARERAQADVRLPQ